MLSQTEQAQIHSLGRCRFGRREFDKRFISDLDSTLRHGQLRDLTRQQRFTLAKIAWRYRRQLKDRLQAYLIPDHEPQADEYGLTDRADLVPDMFSGELTPPHDNSDAI